MPGRTGTISLDGIQIVSPDDRSTIDRILNGYREHNYDVLSIAPIDRSSVYDTDYIGKRMALGYEGGPNVIRPDSLNLFKMKIVDHFSKSGRNALILSGLGMLKECNGFRNVALCLGHVYEDICIRGDCSVLLLLEDGVLTPKETAFLTRTLGQYP